MFTNWSSRERERERETAHGAGKEVKRWCKCLASGKISERRSEAV